MSSPPLRSSRPASIASSFLQNTSPSLPSHLNPPNAFPSGQFNTSRNSLVGEAFESLYSITEGDGSELSINPEPTDSQSLSIPRARTTSLSRSPLYTQVHTQVHASTLSPSVDMSPPSGGVSHSRYHAQPHTYGRHPSPSSSPQGIPFPTSSPFSSSQPSPLVTYSPPTLESFRPLSPSSSVASKRGSPVSIHSTRSQFQPAYRSPPQLSQSHFQLPQTSPAQISPTSPLPGSSSSFRSPRLSLIQQSFTNAYEAHGNTYGFSSFHDDAQHRSPSFDARPNMSPQGSPPLSQHLSVNIPIPQHVSSVNGDMLAVYDDRRASGYGPRAFRDEEIRASFDEVVIEEAMNSCALAYSHAAIGHEAEGGGAPRAVPMSMGSGGSTSRFRMGSPGDHMRGDRYNEVEIGAPPLNESAFAAGAMGRGDRQGVRSRASSIRSQGSVSGTLTSGFVHVGDGATIAKGQEIAHGIEHARERGHGRRTSNASVRSTSSRGSRISGPAQSPSQAMLVSSSQSQTQTFSSLSSLGIGLEEVEREERRSKTFFCRKRAGSAADVRKEVGLSPRVRDGVLSADRLVPSNGDYIGAADDAASPQSPKGTAKHGSLIFGSKNTVVVQQNEGYDRAEKYVSMAVTSILSPSTIRALSPLGDVLIKAAHTASFLGHEAAPLVKDALSLSSNILALAPIPGLDEAAKALVNVWDSCQKVDTNRVSCLRLVERCATLLYAVRREIFEAGEDVANDLAAPLAQLCTALNSVRSFLEAQIHRPLLARYVRRDEITRDLAGCNQVITDAAERFGISVQIRTLKELYAAEHESRQFVEEALQSIRMDNHIMHMQLMEYIQSHRFGQGDGITGLPPGNALGLTTEDAMHAGPGSGQSLTMASLMSIGERDGSLPNTSTALTWDVTDSGDYAASPTPTRTSFVSTETRTATTGATVSLSHTIAGVYRAQDSKDANADVAALRGKFAAAIDTRNDVELLRRLQIEEEEIPEALERVLGLRTHHGLDGEEHEAEPMDGFDSRIMVRGIDAMTRLKNGGGEGIVAWDLPHWTITRYEVNQRRKIDTGFFSDVYLGDWRGRMVVVKALKRRISRELFIREINVWNSLDHPNVLPLYGASTTTGEWPWFFVSKFCSGANILDWLRARAGSGERNEERVDLLKCIHEIAEGMEYLHAQGVVHGNLNAANVLVDENGRCVVSDFGQFEMKAEAYQLSGQTMPLGKPRWKAPELLKGEYLPTPAGDVYAFAISCVEILGMDDFLMEEMDDGLFVASVLAKDVRPKIPRIDRDQVVADAIEDLVCSCWARDPASRPSFAQVVCSLGEIRRRQGLGEYEKSPRTLLMDRVESNLTPIRSHRSSFVDTGSALVTSNESSPADEQYETASEALSADVRRVSVALSDWVESAGESTSARSGIWNRGIHISSEQHSEFSHTSSRASSRILAHAQTQDGGPPPYVDGQQVEPNNEGNYRLIAGMNHAFHESLTLPLWSPTPVKLGAVGYLDKSRGEFITLFNAFEPPRCSEADLCHVPSFYGYGKLPIYSRGGGKRNAAQRSLSALSGFLTFKARGERTSPERIARQYPFPLESGKTTAHLCVERTLHRFIEDLNIPKTWFKLQLDQILKLFGRSHGIGKEDLIVVVGTLDALDYALFVSTAHLDGRARFHVFSDRKKGEPWGMFTTERAAQNGGSGYLASQSRWIEVGGNEQAMFTSKVSTVRVTDAGDPLPCDGMDTVLLAGLKFELDAQEPTLM